MTRLAWLAAIALGPACASKSQLDTKTAGTAQLETRVRTLEAETAQYREDLAWVHAIHQQQKAQEAAEDEDEPAPDAMFAVDIAPDLAAGQVDGPAGACVTIVKAWDFACPYCARASEPLEQLVKAYAGKVRVVYKNMVVHPQIAMPGHLAGCAASKQGKFPEFRHVWWDKAFAPYAAAHDPSKLGLETILAIAKDLKLDEKKFKADMDSPQCQAQVEADMTELAKWHVNATPTFFINGRSFGWDGTSTSFQSAIDDELARVAKSGVACADYYQKVVMDKGEKKFRSKKDAKG
ncbi:MAG TPA: thioredoxin domain-containing protein [Kofleriaceae bacterium]